MVSNAQHPVLAVLLSGVSKSSDYCFSLNASQMYSQLNCSPYEKNICPRDSYNLKLKLLPWLQWLATSIHRFSKPVSTFHVTLLSPLCSSLGLSFINTWPADFSGWNVVRCPNGLTWCQLFFCRLCIFHAAFLPLFFVFPNPSFANTWPAKSSGQSKSWFSPLCYWLYRIRIMLINICTYLCHGMLITYNLCLEIPAFLMPLNCDKLLEFFQWTYI